MNPVHIVTSNNKINYTRNNALPSAHGSHKWSLPLGFSDYIGQSAGSIKYSQLVTITLQLRDQFRNKEKSDDFVIREKVTTLLLIDMSIICSQ
jgi:hypothetical protein